MAIIKPKLHNAEDMYIVYVQQKVAADPELYYTEWDRQRMRKGVRYLMQRRPDGSGEIVMSYSLFKEILEKYNKAAAEEVIEGKIFYLGKGLGNIFPKRIERNFNKPVINHIATRHARIDDPTHAPIYFTDDDYCRINWSAGRTVRRSVYEFIPAKHSFKGKFSLALKSNPVLKFSYRYFPLYHKTKEGFIQQ